MSDDDEEHEQAAPAPKVAQAAPAPKAALTVTVPKPEASGGGGGGGGGGASTPVTPTAKAPKASAGSSPSKSLTTPKASAASPAPTSPPAAKTGSPSPLKTSKLEQSKRTRVGGLLSDAVGRLCPNFTGPLVEELLEGRTEVSIRTLTANQTMLKELIVEALQLWVKDGERKTASWSSHRPCGVTDDELQALIKKLESDEEEESGEESD